MSGPPTYDAAVGTEIGDDGVEELGGKYQGFDLQTTKGALNRFVVHVVVGGYPA